MKALILSVTAGYGHHSTGRAAISALEECGFECTMLDTLEYVNTHLANSVSDGYLFSTKYLSGAYGKAYGTLDKREQKYDKRSIFSIFSKIVSRKLKTFFKNYTPDVVIGTHSYACLLMTYLKDKGIITCPTFGIITDFTVHPFWESTELDYYVTADALLNRQMQKKGIPESKILPYGIPIKKKFSTGYEKSVARELLGISEKRTILVMMGSMGYGNIIENLHAIDSLPEDFQVLCTLEHGFAYGGHMHLDHVRVFDFLHDFFGHGLTVVTHFFHLGLVHAEIIEIAGTKVHALHFIIAVKADGALLHNFRGDENIADANQFHKSPP